MNVIKGKEQDWEKHVEVNKKDIYSHTITMVAERVSDILDERSEPLKNGYWPDANTAHGVVCQADRDINAGGITGFMAGAVCSIIRHFHPKGEEFYMSYTNKMEESKCQ